jgi:hypothetical protein
VAGGGLFLQGIILETGVINTWNEKKLLKSIEQVVKSLGISVKEYGVPLIKELNDTRVSIGYPLLLNQKPVWEAAFNQQIMGVEVIYNFQDLSLSVWGSVLGKYEYSNIPTIWKEEILKEFTVWIKKLDAPEVVYLYRQTGNEKGYPVDTYYVPALKFSLENNTALYRELIKF